jgi:hypothetical protein
MRRIVTAISAAALAFSLVASATPANAAVAGYDSAYLGQSDWLVRSQGQTGSWTVIFQNTGTTTWTRGTSTEVEFAACLEDKVTCNQQDASEAPFNSGWLSTTRYADMNQTAVAPAQAASFTVNIIVPSGQAAGTYHFNGAVVKADTGADIRNEGAFFDVLVPAATGSAATITSISPTTGSTAGGTTVTITGTNFACTPATPTVTFDTTAATVSSCGSTTLTTTSPAHAAGSVNVTVTNSGAAASNAVTFVYADTTRPTYNSVTAQGTIATVTFSEAVCRNAVFVAGDWTSTVNGVANVVTGDSVPACNATFTNGVTTANVFLTTAAPNGSFVAVTLETQGGNKLRDTAGNLAVAPRSNTTTATAPDTTAPTLTGASGSGGSTTLTLTFSEPVWCGDAREAGDITVTTGTTTIASTATNTCGTTAATATTSYEVTLASALASSTSYSVTVTSDANETQDVTGNDLASPATTSFVSGAQDTTAPTITDARIVTNSGLTTNMDSGDVFTLTFSEAMNTTTAGDQISVEDADTGSVDAGTITCGTTATCTFATGGLVLTVTITGLIGANDVGYPATITSLLGFGDTGGNQPNLGGSSDRIIDSE